MRRAWNSSIYAMSSRGDISPDEQGRLKLARGIEVGHVFQLRDKYAQAMNVSFLDQ